MKKFSKPSSDILKIKQSFFDDNDRKLESLLKANAVYLKQPPRTQCKNCYTKISGADFSNFGIEYSICENCGHLNGTFEDTEDYVDFLYGPKDGAGYSETYLEDSEAFANRVEKIYLPKAEFLKEVMQGEGLPGFSLSDFGCGAGFFISAARSLGIKAVGFEVSSAMAKSGNAHLGEECITVVDSKGIYDKVLESDADVICVLGVLEHLKKPRLFLDNFKKSAVDYLYLSVPLFSLSVFLENAFPGIMPRQLSGGHTHLYTKESLAWLRGHYDLEEVGSWWFGTDITDLYRSMSVTLIKNGLSPKAISIFQENFKPLIDQMQAASDNAMWCSEVHMVLKKA